METSIINTSGQCLTLNQALCELCKDVFADETRSWASGVISKFKESLESERARERLIIWNIAVVQRVIDCATKANENLQEISSVISEMIEKQGEDKGHLTQFTVAIEEYVFPLLNRIVSSATDGLGRLRKEKKVITETLAWGEIIKGIENGARQLKDIEQEAQQTKEDRIKPIARNAVRILNEVASLPVLFGKLKMSFLPETMRPEDNPESAYDFLKSTVDGLEVFVKQTAKNAAMSKANIKRLINQ